jgi:hypothetical protein
LGYIGELRPLVERIGAFLRSAPFNYDDDDEIVEAEDEEEYEEDEEEE